ncbi:MAG: valine--tRNA ligase [Proteobacteria bacterium]|nr:valine--tRNA ligase [Pseudomonadota bacterium]
MDSYQPQDFETKWYKYWESNNLFSPDIQNNNQCYTIVIPPPNVTGSLHIGHALVNTLQDVLIRWKRMSGYKTLWLPGTDHAGIATQMVVERELRKKGLEREELGREKFIAEIWKWKEQSGNAIFKQLKHLGASLDWSRERFTLDEGLSKAVKKSFVDLYQEGLIYRGDYIVNWCPNDKTALSDLEVDYMDKEGTITNIAYPIENGEGEIIVATTRPETMLGDTAVAVHPEDERYRHLVGKQVRLPLVNRLIPIIADDFVDRDFGSGAVKITPAHDPNDFLMGQRHKLPSINIFNEDASLNSVFPLLEGKDRFEARKEVILLLKKEGVFREEKSHLHSVGHCQRCSSVIEPRLSTQWFCKMKKMAEASLEAVEKGELKFSPASQGKIFHEWMSNIQDWCLSRQIWWGHRIPAWYCADCSATIVSEEEEINSCSECGSKKLVKEKDVLDTWFSSGLFPFSTMGWPEKTEDLNKFYPNSTLITGYDILFFWVARMIMLGIKKTGQVPFPEVFLHGLVRDESGDKMSKTKGNVIDPLMIIDKFGADALRFTLASLTVMGRDVKLPEAIIEGNRNFINKIWNATKFTLFHIDRLGKPEVMNEIETGIFDLWILQKLENAIFNFDRYLKAYRFNEAAKCLYGFIWHQYCDWYLEIVKPMLFGKLGKQAEKASLATLHHVLDSSLKLLHPLMPFVTEELWQKLPFSSGSIMIAEFPKVDQPLDPQKTDADSMIEMISTIRNIRGENNIKASVKIDVKIATRSESLKSNITLYNDVILALGGIRDIQVSDDIEKTEGLAGGVGEQFEVFVNLAASIDIDQETKRLEKEKSKLENKQKQLGSKLTNKGFLAKAPEAVIIKDRNELEDITRRIEKIDENIEMIKGLEE